MLCYVPIYSYYRPLDSYSTEPCKGASVDLMRLRNNPTRERSFAVAAAAALLAGALALGCYSATPGARPHPASPAAESFRNGPAELPLYFEGNSGQSDSSVRFLAHGRGCTLFLTEREAVLSLQSSRPRAGLGGRGTLRRVSASSAPAPPREGVLRIRPIDSNPQAAIEGLDPLPGHVNYFVGGERAEWRTDIQTFARVRYRAIYPGIDLVYHGGGEGLEFDLIAAPHAALDRLRLSIEGADAAAVDSKGDLRLTTAAGAVTIRKPRIYQDRNGVRYALDGNYSVRRAVPGPLAWTVAVSVVGYDRDLPLVIDPQLVYSTYLGGSGDNFNDLTQATPFLPTDAESSNGQFALEGSDAGLAVAVDSSGDIYVAGIAYSSNFPVSTHALQASDKGSGRPPTQTSNAFIAKLDPTKSGPASLIYSTYLGGGGDPSSRGIDGDFANGIAVDGNGEAYVAGTTYSRNFPHAHCGPFGASNNQGAPNINNGFVTELTPAGDGLVYSCFINGSDGAPASRIAIVPGCPSNCAAYVSGSTASNGPNDFVIVNGNQTTNPDQNSQSAAYLMVIAGGGGSIQYSTFYGGSGTPDGGEVGTGIAVDSSGRAYMTGLAFSVDLPLQNPLQASNHGAPNGEQTAFVAEFDPSQSGAASLLYSSYLGGSSGDNGSGIAVDAAGHIVVDGITSSIDFPVVYPFQAQHNGAASGAGGLYNAFVSEIDPSQTAQSQLIYSTYLGGSGGFTLNGDGALDLALDGSGHIFVAGVAFSADFPVTPAACQQQNNSILASFNAFVSELDPTQTANPASQLLFSTYLGGALADLGSSIRVDSAGRAAIAGLTYSTNFPLTPSAFQKSNRSFKTLDNFSSNAFVTELDPSSSQCQLPVLEAVPAKLKLGNSIFGGTAGAPSAPQRLELFNPVTPLQNRSVTVDSISGSPGFNVPAGVCVGSLLPLDRCALEITYTPSSLSAAAGSITVIYNSGQSTLSVPAAGTSVLGTLEVKPAALDFGKVAAGNSSSKTVKVINPDPAAIDMGPYNIGGRGAGFAIGGNTCASSVAANSSCQITVTFTPPGRGRQTGTLSIGNFTRHNPIIVKLAGALG